MPRSASALALLIGATLLAAPAAVGKAKLPENDKSLGPNKSVGYFLGSPQPTYSWHGCTKSDTRQGPKNLVDSTPNTEKSTNRYVTFTLNPARTYPQFSWRAKAGWTICGVQAAVQLSSPDVDSDLLAEAGYTSGPTKGSTAVGDGRETIKVRIPTQGIRVRGFEQYEGKTFSIVAFQSVTVFVKKK